MENEIKFIDESGDKDFFTIVPNFILNHSSAIDQSLYLQMKRKAGETGKCFATVRTLMKSMKVGNKIFNKSLEYLLKNKWITYIGKTEGKTRPINTYIINNIWEMNTEYYLKKENNKKNKS